MHPALAARRRRIATLRRRIVAVTLATFALAWGAVVWDGSMGATTVAQTTTSSDSTTSTTTEDDSATLSTGQSSGSCMRRCRWRPWSRSSCTRS